MTMQLIPGQISLDQLRDVFATTPQVKFVPGYQSVIELSHQVVQSACEKDAAVYGINTGFGKLANKRIAHSDLELLQLKLLRSHAVGVGEPMSERVVRLMLLLKAASLAQGYSGVRLCVVEMLLDLVNHNILPVIPCQGSVGASGDLAPLAHLSLPLIGEGEVFFQGIRMPAQHALEKCQITPLNLQAKEGLALINGTQASTALAIDSLFACENLLHTAMVSGALTLDAARGSDAPFDARIHAVRGQKGQMDCAAIYRELTAGSKIRESHLEDDDRVQDPYCLRCQPQVMGACLDQMRYAAKILLREANAVTDNPLVFSKDFEILSGGNFHAEPVAFAADALAIVIAEIGSIAERRIAMLVDAAVSKLPAFLTPEPGLNSGFMIVHVTAAALASENKSHAHPASVDSLPTSANQEDHVSMATFAARRLSTMLKNTSYIIAIELLTAAQAIEFLRPLTSSKKLENIFEYIRTHSPAMMQDRSLAGDIEEIYKGILKGDLLKALKTVPSTFESLNLSND